VDKNKYYIVDQNNISDLISNEINDVLDPLSIWVSVI
jgi:hypothetical protein